MLVIHLVDSCVGCFFFFFFFYVFVLGVVNFNICNVHAISHAFFITDSRWPIVTLKFTLMGLVLEMVAVRPGLVLESILVKMTQG